MGSTHYMDLLMTNSPWNLIFFMAIPVMLAESIAISELYLLWTSKDIKSLESFNRICGICAGIAFAIIIMYFIPNIIMPLTDEGKWRTWIDVVAIYSYVLSGVPMILIALVNINLLCRNREKRIKRLYQIVFLSAFLILSHVAMIFGMVDPTIAGWDATEENVHMHHMQHMSNPGNATHNGSHHHGHNMH